MCNLGNYLVLNIGKLFIWNAERSERVVFTFIYILSSRGTRRQQEIGGTFCVEMFNIHKTCEEGGLEMEILQQSETILIKGSKNG